MLDILVQFDLFGKLIQVSIDQDTDVAASLCLIQKLRMRSLSSSDHRCKKLELCTLRQRHDVIHHLVYCLLFNLLTALRTVRDSDSCVQQTKIIINLRHSSYGRTRISVC